MGLTPVLWKRRDLRLRKRLEAQGFAIVNRKYARELSNWERQREALNQAQDQAWSRVWKLEDQIKELEAEIEAHKRVNAALARRMIEATHE